MKADMFDTIVEARANERVQKRINAFKKEITEAVVRLNGGRRENRGGGQFEQPSVRAALAVLTKDAGTTADKGWPVDLWKHEREDVAGELLETMDEMQKALIAVNKVLPEDQQNIPEDAISAEV